MHTNIPITLLTANTVQTYLDLHMVSKSTLILIVSHNSIAVFHPAGESLVPRWAHLAGSTRGAIHFFVFCEVSGVAGCGRLPRPARREEEADFGHQMPTPCATCHASKEHVQSRGKTSHLCAKARSKTVLL